MLCTKVRKETFAKNKSVIEQAYGKLHSDSVGGEINKYGYPDMGNNIYADHLPYKDWLRMNNA